ncbi:MAG: hypothetical protein ABJG47_18910 [Ekhidna sp.]
MMKTITIKSAVKSFMFLLLLVSFSSTMAQKKFVLIANNDVPLSTIDKSTLKRVYNGFTTQWSNGLKAKPSYISSNVESFWAYIGTSKANFDKFWTKRVFSGNGVPPIEHKANSDAITYVSRVSGAIGIIEASEASNIGDQCKMISLSD